MSICDDMQELPLPRYLHQHRDEVVHVFDQERGVAYGLSSWQDHFRSNPRILRDLDVVKQQCPNRITRDDVNYFAGRARYGGSDELRRLFLVCMVWGWGKGGKKRRGFSNTEVALADPRLMQTIQKATENIRNGQIKAAYEGFKLNGCRSAFFTKLFYFVGRECNIRPLPLILDRRVSRFLTFLGGQEGWDSSIFTGADGYLQYVCSMDDWASQLGCPADNIEYSMYRMDKSQVGYSRRKRGVTMTKVNSAHQLTRAWMHAAKRFCEGNNLAKESVIIGAMHWPSTWHLPKTGPGGEPEWRFRWAVRGSFERMWEHKGITARPPNWGERQQRWLTSFRDYLSTQEGVTWQKNHNPSWVSTSAPPQPIAPSVQPQATGTVTVSLSPGQTTEIKKLAGEWQLSESDVVRILVSLSLRQLR